MPEPQGVNVRNKEIEELPGWKFASIGVLWVVLSIIVMPQPLKGIMQSMTEGPLTGSNCQNIRVCIYDGKMHAVDSNDIRSNLAASCI